jgi:hypothetical protein
METRSSAKSKYALRPFGFTCVHVLSLLQVKNLIGGMRGLKALLWEGSVLDPNEARAYPMMLSVKFLTYIIRVSASMDCPSQIAKKNSPLPSMARRSSPRACSGSCSPDRSRPQNKSVPFRMSSRSVESFQSLSRNSLTRVFLRRQSMRGPRDDNISLASRRHCTP